MPYQVDFEPIGRRIRVESDTTLLDAAQRAGVLLTAICGGEGSCGRCIVRVMSGQVSSPTMIEQAELGRDRTAAGWRLACQTIIASDVHVHVPPDSLATAQRTQTEGQAVPVELQPAARAFDVQVAPPTLDDLRSDAARVRAAIPLSHLSFDARVLRRLSSELRDAQFHLAALVRGNEVVGTRPAGASPLGLAVDIGTTKLAAYLADLQSGETLVALGAMNPQIAYGEDVMARINHAISHREGAEQLRAGIVDALNGLARDLCAQALRHVADIADAVVVGNTAMHHLFLGLPVRQLGLAPYVAAESAALDVKARDVGLDLAPGAYVHLLPNVAGFVGADHLAMLLATGVAERDDVVLAMDIGTNTEVSLRAHGKHFACSTASGPAFEGAHIRFGMRAAPGAIERVSIRDGKVHYQTVGNMPPTGLCGSGILDLAAQMRHANIINARGAFPRDGNAPRVRRNDRGFEFVVVTGEENGGTEITFDRKDISEIQLAKGAMRAGVNILLKHAGVTDADVDELIIAGAFGTYLDIQSGLDIGMFPKIDRDKIRQVGNAAGAGARIALLSVAQRERAVQIAHQIQYVELTSEPDFQSEFARALSIG
ncbi:MAG: DUF4445 domain-containing protein [Chloroflexi bacterium]|nr:DUF4445 domain-containing protein [Chloroflexota bacterium]